MEGIIILGDPHLGGSLSLGKVAIGSSLNSKVSDRFYLLDWTLQQAIDRMINVIVLTGDVFEEPKPHPTIIALFLSWLQKCASYNIEVHIIIGNHDILRTGSFYTSPLDIISECELSNVFIYRDMKTVFFGSLSLTLMPFRDRKSFNLESNAEAVSLLKSHLSYELLSIPRTYKKLAVGHFALEGSIPVGDEIDDLTNELFCPISMFKGFDAVIMGHVHKPQTLSHSDPFVAHIGSMDVSNFGETDHRKHIIIYDPEQDEPIEKVSLPTRSLYKIVIAIPAETKETTKYIIEEIDREYKNLSKSVIRLEIYLSSPDITPVNRLELEKYLYSRGVFYVSSISESKKLLPIKKEGQKTLMDQSMDIGSTIKLWAQTQLPQEKQARFIQTSLDILNDYKAK
jgi:DNA repair exonuclease SbcCD nuclease subunit